LSLGVYNATTKTTAQTVARIGSTLTDKVKNVENITGSRNADVLTGNAGDNVITGELGLDTLTGGLGTDSLYGGADRVKDIFDFNAIADSKMGTARDKVYNFVTKIDKIDLSGIDANTANAKLGDQAFVFNNTSAKANSIWYKEAEVDGKRSTKDIVIYGDVDGNTTADFEIGLVGVTAIAAGDLVH
jgi:Ca2+-binding RTX toxin-like protein